MVRVGGSGGRGVYSCPVIYIYAGSKHFFKNEGFQSEISEASRLDNSSTIQVLGGAGEVLKSELRD